MSEEIKNNELAEEALDNVSGGVINPRSVIDKKGLRVKSKAGIAANATSNVEAEVAVLDALSTEA